MKTIVLTILMLFVTSCFELSPSSYFVDLDKVHTKRKNCEFKNDQAYKYCLRKYRKCRKYDSALSCEVRVYYPCLEYYQRDCS